MSTSPHLRDIEEEAIFVLREVTAEVERPVLLYSMGKDSAALLHLVRKSFAPAPIPFPLLHVDTTWKFRDMYAMRDRVAAEAGVQLLIHRNPDALALGVNPFDHGSEQHTRVWKTDGLLQALYTNGFKAAIAGARRDEEKSRAKERIISVRDAAHRWDPRVQRPELWRAFNLQLAAGQSLRVFPLSNWTELDVWEYIGAEGIEVVPLYFAAVRPVVQRNGLLLMVDDGRMPILPGERVEQRLVRFRTLGCYPLSGAVESTATSVDAVIDELRRTRDSERSGRAIDHDTIASMEKKKREGYF